MNILKKADDKMEEYFLVLCLAIMVILTFMQVVMRYVFNTSLVWSEELVRFLFLWQIWIGVSFAAKKNKHLRIEMLINKLSPRKKRIMSIIIDVIWLILSIYIAILAFKVVGKVDKTGQLAPALQIPMTIPYLSVAVGFLLMSYRLVQQIYFLIKTPAEGGLN